MRRNLFVTCFVALVSCSAVANTLERIQALSSIEDPQLRKLVTYMSTQKLDYQYVEGEKRIFQRLAQSKRLDALFDLWSAIKADIPVTLAGLDIRITVGDALSISGRQEEAVAIFASILNTPIETVVSAEVSGDRLRKMSEPGARERLLPLPAADRDQRLKELVTMYSERVREDLKIRRRTAANRLARLTFLRSGLDGLSELASKYSADPDAGPMITDLLKR